MPDAPTAQPTSQSTDGVTLVDANVLLDWLTRDSVWMEWSLRALDDASRQGSLAVNPLIYAEVAAGFRDTSTLDRVLPPQRFRRLPLPYEAAPAAARAFVAYRRRGGLKRSPLPDFYIGAHADVADLTLLTRDAGRYRTCFPGLKLVAPPA